MVTKFSTTYNVWLLFIETQRYKEAKIQFEIALDFNEEFLTNWDYRRLSIIWECIKNMNIILRGYYR